MLSHIREQPSTIHVLRVLVRIDTQLGLACLEVRGCLTAGTYDTLAEVLTHTGTLGAAVRVNLLRAEHVESSALQLLRREADAAVSTGSAPASGGAHTADALPVAILVPQVLPVCRLGPEGFAPADSLLHSRLLSNEEAMELAFLRRDPHVLAAPPDQTEPSDQTEQQPGR